MRFLSKYYKSIFAYGLLVSVPAALAEWSSFALGLYLLDWHYIPSSVLAFLVGTAVNTGLSRVFAFHSRGRSHLHEMLLIYAVSSLTFLLNLAVLAAVVEVLGLPAMLGKVAGTGAAFFANYAARQFFIFSSAPRWK